MKQLILAGIVIIICCLVFLIVRQNSSQADIGVDIYAKPYLVPFGDWVHVYLCAIFQGVNLPDYAILVKKELIEDKYRFSIVGFYKPNTEIGKRWYQETFPLRKETIRMQCRTWTRQGYPISLNDFQFNINALY